MKLDSLTDSIGVSMVDYIDTEVFAADSQSPSASSDHRFEVGGNLGFGENQDTEPIDDEVIRLDSSLIESPFHKLYDDTELVDDGNGSDEETLELGVVDDSEDEDVGNGSVVAAESSLKAVDTLLESDGSNDQKCHTGLDILDSQEPGEATQANALGFVDQFLMGNDLNLSPVGLQEASGRKKSPPFSGAKGAQSLAKRIKTTSPTRKMQVFDWDSGQCDVSDPQSSSVSPANVTRFKRRKDHVADVDPGKKKGFVDMLENRKAPTFPTQGFIQNSSAEHHKTEQESGFGQGIMNIAEMDAPLQDKESKEQLEPEEDFNDIGINTQIAAEAMSSLLYTPCTKEEACESGSIPGEITKTEDQVSNLSKINNDTIEAGSERDNWSGSLGAQQKERNSKKKRNFTKMEGTRKNDSAIICLANLCEWRHPRAKRSRLMQRHHILSRKPWVGSSVKDRSEANTLSSGLQVPLSATRQASSCQSGVNDSDVANHAFLSGTNEGPCNKALPRRYLLKELTRLGEPGKVCDFTWKDLRRRRNLGHVRVLFSHNLDDETVKQQKKIMVRLGISEASCAADSTHFIADRFARTRNMLEAIALGKFVVTPLWLESCRETRCLIDEKSYILRDSKIVKDGFCMLTSLARAKQRPLLKGFKVCITPNIKPSRDMIADLVKVTQGQVVEKSEIIAAGDRSLPDDLLILSCEDDRKFCLPFINRGAVIYTSELLLNGIVIQKLEYARHALFSNGDTINQRNAKFRATRALLSAY